MNKWMLAFWSCLTVLITSNVFLIYSIVDQSTTLAYSSLEFEEQVRANEILGEIIVQGGEQYSKKELLFLLRQIFPNAFIVEKADSIIMGVNRFEFSNGKLVVVR